MDEEKSTAAVQQALASLQWEEMVATPPGRFFVIFQIECESATNP